MLSARIRKSSLAVVLGRALGKPVVLDTHNVGIEPFTGGKVADVMATALARGADVLMVHNDDLVPTVERRGGRPYVLPDPVPELPPTDGPSKMPPFDGRVNVLYVCTYDKDEPYLEVARAGALLPPDVHIYVTGRKSHLLTSQNPPPNVIATGFLSESDYGRAIRTADIVMVLTNMERCAQCGAYEAVSAGKPMVLTGTHTLRSIFSRGTVYTENRAEDIARAIEEAARRKDELSNDVATLKGELEAGWDQRLEGLQDLVHELTRGKRS